MMYTSSEKTGSNTNGTFPAIAFPSDGYLGVIDGSNNWARIINRNSAAIGNADHPMDIYAR